MRLIPGRTKVQIEFARGITIADVAVGGFFAAMIFVVISSTLSWRYYIALGLLVVAIILLVRLDAGPNYHYLLQVLRHYTGHRQFYRTFTDEELQRRHTEDGEKEAFVTFFEDFEDREKREEEPAHDDAFEMKEIVGFTDIRDNMIDYNGEYYGIAIEIPPVEFRFFSANRRANTIESAMGSILRALPVEYAANIVKLERPIMYDSHLDKEYEKLDALRADYERGVITEEELKSRVEILYDSINDLRELCYHEKVLQPFYYLVLFDSDRQQLLNNARYAEDSLRSGEMNPHRLNNKELAIFLKYTNQIDFDERDIDKVDPADYALWAMPQKVEIKPKTVVVNQIITHNLRILDYPFVVGDAWLATVMSMPATKVVVKCMPMDRAKAIRGIDRSLSELRGQWKETGLDSKRLELQGHIETLNELLSTLQNDNETLMQVSVYITAYDINQTRATESMEQPPISLRSSIANMKKVVRRTYTERGFKLNGMYFDQMNAFIGGQVSAWDPMRKKARGIPSNTVAAMYPWVFAHVSDENGIKLGYESSVPVFVDFFRRNTERVNSNLVIVGKSGSGKSYAAKSLLTHLAADDTKIFILDPENEYSELAGNLHGKFINVGNAQYGRLNPFHVMTSLDDDEGEGVTDFGSFATHLQFLEEFFRQIMPDCDRDALEYLNSIVERLYTNRGITEESDFFHLQPEAYPTFDELYAEIVVEFQNTDNEYIRRMLRTLMTHVSKFSTGGRNANIWNGPSTITTEENFTVFNFQSLLANHNSLVANAQMLLVLRYLNNEIIKNRDYNTRYKTNRRIVVVIDEAHVFIDEKYPVALDFMYQMAKRIRKYNGMQIVITQNIKDFVGSDEIRRKSTAIINACQYSFIFGLAPNDMNDLCVLYEKAGGINELEQEQIVAASRGQAFAIMSPQSRTSFKVQVPPDVAAKFEEPHFLSHYFRGEVGEKNWNDFMGDSREKRQALLTAGQVVGDVMGSSEGTTPSARKKQYVQFFEVSEKEFAEALERAQKPKSAHILEETEQSEVFTPGETMQTNGLGVETEKILIRILEKMGNGVTKDEVRRSVEDEVRRSIREELEREVAILRAMAPINLYTPQSERIPPAPVEAGSGEAEEKVGFGPDFSLNRLKRAVLARKESAAEEQHDSPDMDDMLEKVAALPDVDELGGESEPSEEKAAETASLGSIFNADALAESARLDREAAEQAEKESNSAEETVAPKLDVLAMLKKAAKRVERTSAIDLMTDYGEETSYVTLDDLVKYMERPGVE